MNAQSRYEPAHRALFIDVTVHDSDIRTILDQKIITAEIRHLIAKEVVGRIMTHLGPLLDDLFKKLAEKQAQEAK